jgi:hypothetical protein
MDSISDKYDKNSLERNKYKLKLNSQSNCSAILGLIVLIVFKSLSIQAQEISYSSVSDYDNHLNKVIGLDENLINGYQYINQYSRIKGHVFFGENEFVTGSVVLNKKTYTNVLLKYDILNQDVILSYKTSLQGINHIVLRKNLITEFELDGKYFERLYFPQTDIQFFQVVCNKSIKCLYLWRKTLEINPQSVHDYFECSDQRKQTYLVIDNDLKQYSGKRSFIKLFPEDLHVPINKYMSKQKIKIKDAPDRSIIKLIEFCESLVSKEIQ